MYIAIGDIHAEGKKLDKMMLALKKQGVDFKEDTLVFLGDYVDGGREAKYVIQYLIDLQKEFPHYVFLMGNHEDMLLCGIGYSPSVCRQYRASFDNWYTQGGKATAESYANGPIMPYPELIRSQIPKEHLEWMRTLPLFHETEDFIFVHAGINQDVAHSDPIDLLWTRGWYANYQGKPVIYGHTCSRDYLPTLYPQGNPTSIGIDTMHHGHGYLTAALLDKTQNTWYSFLRV